MILSVHKCVWKGTVDALHAEDLNISTSTHR